MCLREQRQCKITCNLVVNGNVIKSLYAEIVAVLRTHEGAAVVGRTEKFKSAAALSLPLSFTPNLKVILQQSPSTTHAANERLLSGVGRA